MDKIITESNEVENLTNLSFLKKLNVFFETTKVNLSSPYDYKAYCTLFSDLKETIFIQANDKEKKHLSVFFHEVKKFIFSDISFDKTLDLFISSASGLIERELFYEDLAKKLLLKKIYYKIFGKFSPSEILYRSHFQKQIIYLVQKKYFSPQMSDFNFEKILSKLDPKLDNLFTYHGLETLKGRYLFQRKGQI